MALKCARSILRGGKRYDAISFLNTQRIRPVAVVLILIRIRSARRFLKSRKRRKNPAGAFFLHKKMQGSNPVRFLELHFLAHEVPPRPPARATPSHAFSPGEKVAPAVTTRDMIWMTQNDFPIVSAKGAMAWWWRRRGAFAP